jgi:DNA-binding SARP family transcriptional activator
LGYVVTSLHLSILGPVKIRRAENTLKLGSPQQQAMFVALLLRTGRSASASDLVEALWGANVPASAMTTLRTYAWRLRKVLEIDSKSPGTLISLGDGYRLVIENEYADFLHVQELANEAERAKRAGDLHEAYDLLESALSLWQGEALAAIPGPFAERQRDRFNELRLTLQEEWMVTALTLGSGGRHIPDLTGLIHQHPLRERLYGLLMHAQYQSGRRADALATYRDARRLLLQELGVEPGPELVTLQQGILNGDLTLAKKSRPTRAGQPRPSSARGLSGAIDRPASAVTTEPDEDLSATEPVVSPPPPGPQSLGPSFTPAPQQPVPAQLPPGLADFTGRSHLLVTLGSAMNPTKRSALPVVVLVGMGGVGKSALALQVAHHVRDSYPDGQLYADLRAGNGDPAPPEIVLADFLVALGVASDSVPDTLEARTALLRTLLDRRRMLIMLDDAKDAEQVRSLLPGAADCGVLVTSRSRLIGLPAAIQAELRAFYPAEAMELLERTIGRERVESEQTAALELVESCAFLPLAVRIVAARLAARPTWTICSLARRLADERRRIDELKAGDMTIAAAFEVSYRQLTADQSRAIRLVASVDGPTLSLSSATALLDVSEPDAEELLESLVDAAMLESPSAGEYRIHDLLRVFARRKASSEEQSGAIVRLLQFLLASAVSAFQQVVAGDPVHDALGHSNVVGLQFTCADEARTWAQAEGGCALALASQIAHAVLAAPGRSAQEPGLRSALSTAVDLLIALSPFRPNLRVGTWTGVIDLLIDAARCGDLGTECRTHFLSGNLALAMFQLSKAEREARLAVQQCRAVDDVVILRQALNDLGLVAQFQGEFQEAIDYYDEAIQLARQLGHSSGEIASTVNSALLHIHSGRPQDAVRICERVLDEWRSLSDDGATAYTYYVLGMAHHSLGAYGESVNWYERCLSLCVTAGLGLREAHSRFRLADSLRMLGQFERAVAEAEHSVRLCEDNGDLRNHAQALLVLGTTLQTLGDVESARKRLTEAHDIFQQLGLPESRQAAVLLADLDGRPGLTSEEHSGRPPG